jgi:hypothetical protein
MQPIPSFPEASAQAAASPLATPAGTEAQRTALGQQLEVYLAPLVAFCDQQLTDDNLDQQAFRHGHAIREAIAALLRYDEKTEELLTRYRTALAVAQPLAAAQVPSLEQVLTPSPTAAQLLAEREADPVYGLGFVRGHRRGTAETQARYEHLVSLYAQYALLVPAASYTASPLATRLTTLLASPAMQQRAALPLATRRALGNFTSDDTRPHAQSQQAHA